MITNLKEAKARLSEYVALAEAGEEVVITVRGKPRARLCSVQKQTGNRERSAWAGRLEEARARYRVKLSGPATDSQRLWDDLRGERL